MKREEKSTLGFMVLTGSSMPCFFIAAIVNASQINRLIIVLVPIIIGLYLMMANSKEKKA